MAVHQRSKVHGSGNIIIQNAGDGVHIEVGLPHLEIIPPHVRIPVRVEKTETDLLNPYNRTIELVGRDADLESLRAWLHSARPVSIRTIIGGAGAGKTRIAIELMSALPSRGRAAWHAGFVRFEELRRFTEHGNLSQWGWTRPTLIVVDYAAISTPSLKALLQHLADHPRDSKDKPLRLLLIEREANPDTGWLDRILGAGFSDANIRELFDPLEPLPLQPLHDTADRRAILTAMLHAAQQKSTPSTSSTALNLPGPGQDPDFDRRLADPVWDDPLYLMMAALTSLSSGVVSALSLSRTELAEALAEREFERIKRFAANGNEPEERLLTHMAAYATLGGGLPAAEAVNALKEESEALGLECPGGPAIAAAHLHAALPGPASGIAAIVPDIIGEAFILHVLRILTPQFQWDTVSRAAHRLGESALATLIRLIQDFSPSGAEEPLEWIEHLIRTSSVGDTAMLRKIYDTLPRQTLALREKAAEVTQLLLEQIPAAEAGKLSEDLQKERAGLLNDLANRLSELGRREEALVQVEEAFRLYRGLAAARPDAFLPYVARSLNNLANMLSDLGRYDAALPHAHEAVRLCRGLAAVWPDAFLPDFAISLNSLANGLSNLGRREEALACGEEAVRIRRGLAGARPDTFLPYLATSLNNLAKMLSDLGRTEDALACGEEAVHIRRRLAAARPDAFLPDLSMSLNNLGVMLGDLGRHEEALAHADEAVRIRRGLAAARPDAFLPALAMSLNNLANRLSALGRREEAFSQVEEAVRLYRGLAAARPDFFLPYLVTSLGALSQVLASSGRHREAAQSTHEALVAIRRLFQRYPEAHGRLVAGLVRAHVEACNASGTEPDMEALEPIIKVFSALQEAQKEE